MATIQLIAAPGAEYHYANPNYQTLALLIQQVSGQSYEAYLQEQVVAPLDMRQTFTSPEAAKPHGLAQGRRFILGRPWPFVEPYDRGLAGLTGSAEAVDTTGAGDAFVAALLKGLLDDLNALSDDARLQAACRYANAAGALTTTRRGAIPALPTAQQVESFLAAQRP